MKKDAMKRMGFLVAVLGILAGNLIGIRAWATDEGTQSDKTNPNDPPEGVLMGYLPGIDRIKTGEHLEAWGGWVGAPFYHVVADYEYIKCCKKTYNAMDGCKGLPVCKN